MEEKRNSRITIREVADRANVSITTVSRCLNGTKRVNPDVEQRILDAVRELNYIPNASAQNIRRGCSNLLGVVVPDIANPYFSGICKEMERLFFDHGYHLIIGSTGDHPLKEQSMLYSLQKHRIDGLIVSTNGQNDDALKQLKDQGLPLVLFDRFQPGLDVDYVLEDNYGNARLCIRYLLDQGHKRIAVVKGYPSIVSARRFEACEDAVKEAGLDLDPSLCMEPCSSYEEYCQKFFSLFTMPDRPTAVFLSNPAQMKYFVMAANQYGIRLPEDLSFTGFGMEDYKNLFPCSATCMIQDYESSAQAIVRIMLERLSDSKNAGEVPAKKIQVPCFFHIGSSVRKIF
ncbi:LacI family DNA-binding transcriptional regulator [Clostridium sp. MCC353]|uniref:LacI family DNA-binding transcriptional regulator n=1 Tax=Clostridium sp. MCC353 TaxID=2592646 RepID=UPI001C027549|nr:LacI family DNA-binding transcriptional regulator [Clostridium sp. MCC353]MBT9779033.1 LacI family DNA-binding transcriptional regulator [Clostridium sp. MCC353]